MYELLIEFHFHHAEDPIAKIVLREPGNFWN